MRAAVLWVLSCCCWAGRTRYVTEVTAANYADVVMDKENDVLLLVEKAGGCAACEEDLIPIQLETVGWRVSKMAITVAHTKRSADGMSKLLPSKNVVASNTKPDEPELWFFGRDFKDRPIDFDEEPWGDAMVNIHTVHDYTNFLLSTKFWSDAELQLLHEACGDGPRGCTRGRMPHEQKPPPKGLDVKQEAEKVEKAWNKRLGFAKDEL